MRLDSAATIIFILNVIMLSVTRVEGTNDELYERQTSIAAFTILNIIFVIYMMMLITSNLVIT